MVPSKKLRNLVASFKKLRIPQKTAKTAKKLRIPQKTAKTAKKLLKLLKNCEYHKKLRIPQKTAKTAKKLRIPQKTVVLVEPCSRTIFLLY